MKRLAFCLAAALASGAHAMTVQLTVLDKSGMPAPNVAVIVMPDTPGPPPQRMPQRLEVAQRSMQFVPFLTVVAPGSIVSFTNLDGFDHHVRGTSPQQSFEMRLDAKSSAPPKPASVTLTQVGPVQLGCHLHASMQGHLYVSESPWFAKTGADGKAVVEDMPDGPFTVKLWHPEQLLEQPLMRASGEAAVPSLEGRLNFTPRKRRQR
jgi:plastocyanin|nr:plastocyanin [uncultured Caldimonas sp.]